MTLEIPDSGWDLHHYSYRDCDFDMIIYFFVFLIHCECAKIVDVLEGQDGAMEDYKVS